MVKAFLKWISIMHCFVLFAIGLLCACLPGWAKAPPPLDLETQEIIAQLANHPELMNLNYLQYFIGRPENERGQRALSTKHYIWYLPSRQVRCELRQVEQASGQVVESAFIMPLYDSQLTFKDLEKLYGDKAKHFFDFNGQTNRLYSFTPNSQVAFTCPRNSFHIEQATISYRGPVLPKPSQQELFVGYEHLVKRVQDLIAQESWDEAVIPLMVLIQEHPEDGDSHYWLGRVFTHQGKLHEGIREYETALSISQLAPRSSGYLGAPGQLSGDDLKARCISALQELRVLPLSHNSNAQSPGPVGQAQVVQKGQRIRVVPEKGRKAKKKATTKNQDQTADPNKVDNNTDEH